MTPNKTKTIVSRAKRRARAQAEALCVSAPVLAQAEQLAESMANACEIEGAGSTVDQTVLMASAALFWATDGQLIFRHRIKDKYLTKPVTCAAVRAAFAPDRVESPWFEGVREGVVKWAESARGQIEIRYFAPRRYTLYAHYDTCFQGVGMRTSSGLVILHVPMPGLIWAGTGKTYAIFATDCDGFTSKARLYRAPLPNTYVNGSICWGANGRPHVGKGGALDAWRVFWEAPFNEHVVDGASRSHPKDVRATLAEVAGREAYPLDDLSPANVKLAGLTDHLQAVNRE